MAEQTPLLVALAVAVAFTVVLGLRIRTLSARLEEAETKVREAESRSSDLTAKVAGLEAHLTARNEQIAAMREDEAKLKESFESLAADALAKSSEQFLRLAGERFSKLQNEASSDLKARQVAVGEMLKPVREALSKFETKIGHVEADRIKGFSSLKQQLQELTNAKNELHEATHGLRRALSTPSARGQWGELGLRKLVEMAGMTRHCDFLEQETLDGASGRLRPDMVIALPGERRIAVDSKVPLANFLKAMDADSDAEERALLGAHAQDVRGHIRTLSQRSYQEALGDSLDFVVMYLSDAAYAGAVQARPEIIEEAIQEKVVLATPMLLIGLLKTIEHQWRQEKLAEHAEEIRQLGKELYERVAVVGEHLEDLGKGLTRAVRAYNKTVGSMESRLLATGRRFDDLGIASPKSLPEPGPIDEQPRDLTAPEFDGQTP